MASDIRLAISVDASGAVVAVKQVNAALDQIPKSAGSAGMSLEKLKGPAVAAAAALTAMGVAVAAVGAFVGAQAGKLARYSDEVVTLANKFKITTDAVQLFRIAATVGGTTIEGIAVAMQKMQVAIGKGDDVFARLGLSLSTLKGMNADAALETVAKRIAMIKAPAEQAAAAIEVFGKQGLAVLPALADGFGELKDKAQQYGLILRGEVVQAAEAFGDRFDLVNQAWDAFLMRIGAVIANSPAVMTLLDEMGKLFGVMSGWVESNSDALEGWAKRGLALAIDGVIGLAEAMKLATMGIIGFLKFSSIMFNLTGGGVFSKLMGFEGGKALANFDAGAAMQSMLSPVEAFQKAMIEMANAVDASGKKVAASPLFNGSLSFVGASSKAGGAKKGFDLAAASWIQQLQEYARINSSTAMPMPGIATSISQPWLAGAPTKRGADPFSVLAGSGGLMNDPTFVSKMLAAYNEPVVKSSMSASQALQNLANIAATSGSKLGKGLASVLAGGAGIGSAVSGLAGMSAMKGLTGVLGKAGMYGQIAASSIGIISGIVGLFKKKPKEPPPEPPKKATDEAWRNFTGDQFSKGAAGILAGVSGIKVTTAEDMASQGVIASTVFWQMFKDKGIQAAADAFRPVRDKMLETFKAAGADDSAIAAMLGPMSAQIDLAANDAFKGAADGSRGFADALAAIANTQMPMTLDQFRAFELQAVNGFNQMRDAAIDQGLSMEDAIRSATMSSGAYLSTLKDAAAKYGLTLGGSQALFDQAAAAGIAFGGSSEERLIMSIDRLTETLGGAPPKFQAAFSAANPVGGRISDGFSSNGMTDPGAIGDAIAAKLNGAFDRVSSVLAGLADRPIEVTSTINVDGDALANSLASTLDGGGGGASRMRSALEGR